MEKLLIKASMRSADVGHLADQIQRLERGGIDALHFDVMDGRFVPEISLGPLFIKGLRSCTTLPFEVHLLVAEPDVCVNQYLEAGADCILLHVEASRDPLTALRRIHSQGRQGGLATVPGTAAETLQPYLATCDLINVMTVMPGVPGVLHDAGIQTLSQVAAMVAQHDKRVLVQADGAVSSATREQFLCAGARAMVAGYPIFSRKDFGEAITELRCGAGHCVADGMIAR